MDGKTMYLAKGFLSEKWPRLCSNDNSWLFMFVNDTRTLRMVKSQPLFEFLHNLITLYFYYLWWDLFFVPANIANVTMI